MPSPKFILSGGGTGGHIFPAIAIADELKRQFPDSEILFIGARDRMEMEKVPQAGYLIEGLWISGIQRRLTFKNLLFPIKLFSSLFKAYRILKRFKPQVVIGVGGYASAAVLRVASGMKIPTLIQEQNAFPGITNKWLAPRVNTICVAFEGLEKYFPIEKLVVTGNPVRNQMIQIEGKRNEGMQFFDLDPKKPVLLITGGSLGARTINRSIKKSLDQLINSGMQIIWQTGKPFYEEAKLVVTGRPDVKVEAFILRMDLAYACADIMVGRAGAITVSEIELVHLPAILVPLPTAAEDHQTKNAMALVNQKAALWVPDAKAEEQLGSTIIDLMNNPKERLLMKQNLVNLGKANAVEHIGEEIKKLLP